MLSCSFFQYMVDPGVVGAIFFISTGNHNPCHLCFFALLCSVVFLTMANMPPVHQNLQDLCLEAAQTGMSDSNMALGCFSIMLNATPLAVAPFGDFAKRKFFLASTNGLIPRSAIYPYMKINRIIHRIFLSSSF